MTDPPFSPATLAKRWGCTRQFVHKLIKGEQLAAFKVGDKLVRIPVAAVHRYEALRDGAASPDVRRYVTRIQGVVGSHPRDGGFVYFMRCREIVKIGFSTQPPTRQAELQAIIPFELEMLGYVRSCKSAEAALHDAFADMKYPRLNEWFYLSADLATAIMIITKGEGNA
jgi:excisionase family DNA binding protein